MDGTQMHTRTGAGLAVEWDLRVREIYARNPSRSVFSRKPLPYDIAATSGTRRAVLAEQQASDELGFGAITMSAS